MIYNNVHISMKSLFMKSHS